MYFLSWLKYDALLHQMYKGKYMQQLLNCLYIYIYSEKTVLKSVLWVKGGNTAVNKLYDYLMEDKGSFPGKHINFSVNTYRSKCGSYQLCIQEEPWNPKCIVAEEWSWLLISKQYWIHHSMEYYLHTPVCPYDIRHNCTITFIVVVWVHKYLHSHIVPLMLNLMWKLTYLYLDKNINFGIDTYK